MRLYLAGPLFSAAEVAFNARLAAAIEGLGYEVYLPQRDGFEADSVSSESRAEARSQAIFELDAENVLECDVLLCILDGGVPDEGMAVELGIGFADRIHHKPDRKLIGFSTDVRHHHPGGLNAMLLGALDEIHDDEDTLLDRLRQNLIDSAANR
jgi:nucleoside 2-deoxyribosyltransferase